MTTRSGPPRALRWACVTIAVAIAVVATACSGGGSSGGAGGVTVKMLDFRFEPLHVTVRADQALTFDNGGSVTHNFTILRVTNTVNLDVAAGKSASTETIGKLLRPGDYDFLCKFHAVTHGMIGVLTVTAASP